MPTTSTAVERLSAALVDYQASRDPEDLAERAGQVLSLMSDASEEIRVDRQAAILTLRARGTTWADLQRLTGLGRARLNQIARGINGGDWARQRHVGVMEQR